MGQHTMRAATRNNEPGRADGDRNGGNGQGTGSAEQDSSYHLSIPKAEPMTKDSDH
jgi:hypothetical protein